MFVILFLSSIIPWRHSYFCWYWQRIPLCWFLPILLLLYTDVFPHSLWQKFDSFPEWDWWSKSSMDKHVHVCIWENDVTSPIWLKAKKQIVYVKCIFLFNILGSCKTVFQRLKHFEFLTVKGGFCFPHPCKHCCVWYFLIFICSNDQWYLLFSFHICKNWWSVRYLQIFFGDVSVEMLSLLFFLGCLSYLY